MSDVAANIIPHLESNRSMCPWDIILRKSGGIPRVARSIKRQLRTMSVQSEATQHGGNWSGSEAFCGISAHRIESFHLLCHLSLDIDLGQVQGSSSESGNILFKDIF